MKESISYICKIDDDGLYVREIMQQRLELSSRLTRKIKFGKGKAFINDAEVPLKARVKAGDKVSIQFPDEESYFEPQDIPLDVVYEDDDLMVINKQAGLIVHPTYNFPNGTLANAITFRMNERGEKYKLRFVNRLDMYTSGLIIIAKNSHAQDFIGKEMSANRVVKNYIAIVHGVLDSDGTVNLPIDRDPNHMARRYVVDTGYPSVTHYHVIETFPDKEYGSIKGFSLIKLKLDTGRTHQIRVHMTHIGHPLVGDELYAQLYGYNDNPSWMPRQALCASHLEFTHPVTGKLIVCDCDLPKDMLNCLDYIKNM